MLTALLFAGSTSGFAATCDKSDDFTTVVATYQYGDRTTTAGWTATNAAVLQGGATESSPTFPFIGATNDTKAFTINGKTTTIGVITSPTLTGGCSSLSFNYGNAFSETNGVSVKIEIKQNGTVVWTENLVNTSVTGKTLYTYTKTGINVSGDYTLVITNNCPSASTSNKDRVSIFNICMTSYSGSSNNVATPSFTVTPGSFLTPQSVGIQTSTAGAEIRYTTNGVDPTETSTLYTTPISVSTTTTIKAKAFKSGMDASSVASATYTFPTEVATIAALRAATHPGFYKLTGEAVLTLKSATRNTKYIQDATAAVLIDDNSGKITTAYNLGDGITGIIGTTALFNGMLQFTPSVDPGAATSTGKTITPALVEVADLVNYPAQLVKAKNVKFDATGNFAAGTNYVLTGTTSVVVRTQYADLDYVANTIAIPTDVKDIIGVVLIYNATTQLIPRSTADFVVATSVNNPSSKSGIYASEGKVVLTAEAGDVVEVFNAVGQRLVSVKAVSGENHIPVDAKGIVMVRTKGQSTKVVL